MAYLRVGKDNLTSLGPPSHDKSQLAFVFCRYQYQLACRLSDPSVCCPGSVSDGCDKLSGSRPFSHSCIPGGWVRQQDAMNLLQMNLLQTLPSFIITRHPLPSTKPLLSVLIGPRTQLMLPATRSPPHPKEQSNETSKNPGPQDVARQAISTHQMRRMSALLSSRATCKPVCVKPE
ncbi:hypothetical protein BD289DRAFT_256480 [Coniella lustricola]|uniref:Uncharacterized protein n=1 Tax=Coniella lustricola TaxID=2025994 RepID=A0A2T3AKU3_9PEZI|nr:hypothetical protein BD289DRAFT_256480 [Coniella lustricola]